MLSTHVPCFEKEIIALSCFQLLRCFRNFIQFFCCFNVLMIVRTIKRILFRNDCGPKMCHFPPATHYNKVCAASGWKYVLPLSTAGKFIRKYRFISYFELTNGQLHIVSVREYVCESWGNPGSSVSFTVYLYAVNSFAEVYVDFCAVCGLFIFQLIHLKFVSSPPTT